jgi:hypothetical protein
MGEAQGRKSHQRRCGSDDRGEASLRPDQAINEATCVRVLNHDIWRSVAISVLMNKRRERFSGKEKQSPAKGGIVSQERIEIRSFCRGCVGQTECRQLDR